MQARAAILAQPLALWAAPRQAQHPRNSVARCILTHARNESSMPEASPGALPSSLAGVALTWVALYEDGGLWAWQPCRMRLVRQDMIWPSPHISLHSVSNTRRPWQPNGRLFEQGGAWGSWPCGLHQPRTRRTKKAACPAGFSQGPAGSGRGEQDRTSSARTEGVGVSAFSWILDRPKGC